MGRGGEGRGGRGWGSEREERDREQRGEGSGGGVERGGPRVTFRYQKPYLTNSLHEATIKAPSTKETQTSQNNNVKK